MLCSFSLLALPGPRVLLLSSRYVRADLSRETAVFRMAGHLSIPPQAVRVPFNLTCNFPGEVYKSHKQNFNVVKYLTETVNISFFMRTGCMATGLRKDEDIFQVSLNCPWIGSLALLFWNYNTGTGNISYYWMPDYGKIFFSSDTKY